MKPRMFAALLLALAVEIGTLAAPARAGECFGMINYEYSGGDCTDKDGDTSGAMSTMWDDSYHQQQSMIQRSKQMFSGGTGSAIRMHRQRANVPTPREERAMQTTLLSHMKTPSGVIDRIATALAAKTPRERRVATKFLREAVNEFTLYGPSAGFGRLYVFDGDHVADRLSRAISNSVISGTMIRKRSVPYMSDIEKRRLYDAYIIYGVALVSEYRANL
jgi:hypothetical protein